MLKKRTVIDRLDNETVIQGLAGNVGLGELERINEFFRTIGDNEHVYVKEDFYDYEHSKSMMKVLIASYQKWFAGLDDNTADKVNNFLKEKIVINAINYCEPVEIDDLLSSVRLSLQKSDNESSEKKGNEKMNFGFDNMLNKFMPSRIGDDEVGLSLSGDIAYRRKNGDYVYYDPEKDTIENCMEMVISSGEIGKMVFVMPTNTVKVGDVIQNGGNYVYITQTDPVIKGVALNTGRKATIVKENNAITQGALYRKVTSLFTMMNGKDGTGFNPMFLAMLSDSDEENDMFSLLAMSQLMGGNLSVKEWANNTMFGNMNPMMMLMLGKSGDGKMGDMMKLMMMSQMFGN